MMSFAFAALLVAQEYPRHEVQLLGLQHCRQKEKRFRYDDPQEGFAVAYVFNASRISGLRAEVSGTPGSRDATWVLLGGQLKSQREALRWRPFAHFMSGARFETDRTSFATVVGVGLDIKLTRHFDLRLLQAEYAPYRRGGRNFHDGRAAFGLVIH
jgi:hypothetical protein